MIASNMTLGVIDWRTRTSDHSGVNQSPGRPPMTDTIQATDARQVARDYITLWNETDADRRGALLSKQWTGAATYVDPLAKAQGPVEIGAYIGGVHQRF